MVSAGHRPAEGAARFGGYSVVRLPYYKARARTTSLYKSIRYENLHASIICGTQEIKIRYLKILRRPISARWLQNAPTLRAVLDEGRVETERRGHGKGAFAGVHRGPLVACSLSMAARCLSTSRGRFRWSGNAKRLRALQEREFNWVGGNRTVKVDDRSPRPRIWMSRRRRGAGDFSETRVIGDASFFCHAPATRLP